MHLRTMAELISKPEGFDAVRKYDYVSLDKREQETELAYGRGMSRMLLNLS